MKEVTVNVSQFLASDGDQRKELNIYSFLPGGKNYKNWKKEASVSVSTDFYFEERIKLRSTDLVEG